MRFKLGKEDRVKLGLDDEWLEYDENRLMSMDAVAIQREAGISPAEYFEGLAQEGPPPVDEFGERLFDDKGEPIPGDPQPNAVAMVALLWLATRSVRRIKFRDFNINMGDVDWGEEEAEDEPAEDEEKPARKGRVANPTEAAPDTTSNP